MAEQEVVISGLAGRFPGSDNVDELRENLFNKVDLVTDKDCRWNLNDKHGVPNATGKMNKASKFDASHFGIHRKQVESLDPMTCLMMERAFEAVYDAGINPTSLKGRNVGVYMGSTFSEADNVFDYVLSNNGFGILGHNRSMLASRVSYYLDINGPSLVHLSSWSCGLTALNVALRDLKSGRCSAALVGTPNLTLFPVMPWHLSELGVLSRDGKCKSFDSAADGYGRSDAVVVLFLQRRRDAKRVYASVVHSDVRIFGEQRSFLKPQRTSFVTLLRDFYNSCGVDPTALAFLEADGSGVKDSDREELNGVDEALLRHRKSPLLIGSVKSNLGHTETSSSLVSIVKMLIAMETGWIPGNLHYKQPALGVPALEQSRLKVITENTQWSGGYVGINSVGIDGTFGHVLLRSHDKTKVNRAYDGLPRLVVASSRTEDGLTRLLEKVISTPFDAEYVRLLQDVHASNIIGHIYRGFAILEPDKRRNINVEHFPGQKRPVWFVFSGMGSQWPGMGAQLMQLPVFRAAIDRCHAILEPRGLDLRHIVTTPDATIFDDILHCFVGIAAIQIALTDVLTSLGLQPDGLIGHSVGELGCSYADGCLSAEQMIMAAYARGRASAEAPLIKGMMAAVGLGYQQIKDMLPAGVEVACHNGPESCTISGRVDEVEEFVALLVAKGVFARSVNVANIAYHSRYIRPAAPGLLNYLREIIPVASARSPRWISTSVPEDEWDSPLARTCSAEYHTNNLLSSVLFEEGSRHLPADAITIEVAPHGLLQAVLRRSLGEGCTHTALTQRGQGDAVELLLSAVGKLYTLGLHPQVANIYAPVEFPVSRGTPSISPIIEWEHTEDWPIVNDLEKYVSDGEMEVEVSLRQEEVRVYAGHMINDLTVFPAAAYLKLAWETLACIMNETFNKLPVVFEDVRFHDLMYIPKQGSLKLYVMVQRGSGKFEVAEDKKVLATGYIRVPEKMDKELVSTAHVQRSGPLLTSDDVYREMAQRGHICRGQFRSIAEASLNETGSVCRMQWHDNWVTFIECMIQQRIYQTGETSQDVLTPTSIHKLVIDPTKHSSRDAEFEVISHLATSVIQGGGVQIQGINTRSLPLNKNTPVRMDRLVFVTYDNTRLQNIEDFLDVSIQIAVESCQPHCRITLIETNDTRSLTRQIEKCLLSYENINLDVKTTSSATETQPSSFLVVTAPSLLNHGALFLGPTGGFLLSRFDDADPWGFAPDVLVVAEQHFANGRYVLLRKIPTNEPVPRVIKITEDDDTWQTHLRSSLGAKKHVLLVGDSEPPAWVVSHIDEVNNKENSRLARYMFVLDESAAPFSLTDNWYQHQLQRGLTANLYRNESWGSYRLLPLDVDTSTSSPLPSPTLHGVELNYIGLNKTEFGTGQCKLGHMDFSGRPGPHRWVMGVTRWEDSKPDPWLTWPVPDSWSLEGGATVPLAYATAYYAVSMLGYVRRGENILVHAGASGVGQAAIAVAVAAGLKVFTTVASKKQQDFLTKRFHHLQEHCIYYSENTQFEHDLMLATEGCGVEIILNCWSGERLQASLRCLSPFGRFIQLSKTDFEQNANVGLEAFVNGAAFYGAASDNLFNASHEQKMRLHALVAGGIASGVVQPLERSVFLFQQQDRALRMLEDDEQTSKVLINVREAKRALNSLQQPTQRLKFDSRGSCLIIGGTTENWLDLSNWLLEHGVRNLIVSQSSPITDYVSRRVNLLCSVHRATVKLTTNSATTASGTEKLIEEANSYGPLVSVFTLPSKHTRENPKSCHELLHNLDRASRHGGVQHFVCLLCAGAEGVCQARCGAGFHGLAVRWAGNDGDLGLVLASLDRLLGSNIDSTVVLRASSHKKTNESDQLSDETARLDSFLPATLSDLLLLGADVTRKSAPVELASLSPGVAYVKEVPPVFLVPGLQGPVQKVLQSFARGLMYPAIGLQLPSDGSIQQMASSLAVQVKQLQPSGPYNIVGESWGGTLALEVAKSLECQGDKTHVFLLDAAPATAQTTARHLGDGDHLETNLICRLLSLDSNEVKEEMLSARNWESRLNLAISRLPVGTTERINMLKAAITATHSRIMALLQYKPEGSLVTSVVTLVRARPQEEDTCGLIEYCKNTVNVFRIGNDHEEMLTSQETANMISDYVIV